MAIKQTKSVADIPSSDLEDWGPVPQPISETVSQLSGIIINEHPDAPKPVSGSVRRVRGHAG